MTSQHEHPDAGTRNRHAPNRRVRHALALLGLVTVLAPIVGTASTADAAGEPVMTWFGPVSGSVVSGQMIIDVLAVPVDPATLVKWCLEKDGAPVTSGVTAVNSPMLIRPVGSGTFNPSTGCWSGGNLWQANFVFDTTAWPDGDHTYQVTVTDSLGTSTTSGPVTITNINLPPTIHWDYPADDSTLSGTQARFVASGAPDPKGTATVSKWCLLVDGSPATANWSVPQFLPPSTDIANVGFDETTGCWTGLHLGSGEFWVDTTRFINGPHTLTVTSTDTSGRTATDTIPFKASNRKAPTSVTAGGRHSCARVVDGTVRCWGANESGQLGDGTTTTRTTPRTTPGLQNVISLAAGGAHTCAALSDGSVWCWGSNADGQLGTGDLVRRLSPSRVTVAGGSPLAGAVRVASGKAFTCAVVAPGASGTVYCWGRGAAGQLGNGINTGSSVATVVLNALGAPLVGVVSISAGGSTACAVLASGSIRCWGANAYGQIGDGTLSARNKAVQVAGIDGSHAVAKSVAVGATSSCARMKNNSVRCWGRNDHGQLGDGSRTNRRKPVAVKLNATLPLAGATTISVGASHACAVAGSAPRSVWCWGQGADGQLGNGSTADRLYPIRLSSSTTANATQLACGSAFTLAIVPSSARPPTDVAAWGRNAIGQLGLGDIAPRTRPRVVATVF